MTTPRCEVIVFCKSALDRARGACREDDDGTISDMVWQAKMAARAYPDVAARFKAAVAKTEWAY